MIVSPRVGDRVKIIRADIASLYHRKKPWYGYVENIDGDYVYVRPCWCRWTIELYFGEIELMYPIMRRDRAIEEKNKRLHKKDKKK